MTSKEPGTELSFYSQEDDRGLEIWVDAVSGHLYCRSSSAHTLGALNFRIYEVRL